MKIRHVPGGHVDLEGPRRFVALRHLRFGDGWLEPGDLVPVEAPERNYGLMVQSGDIAQVIEPKTEPAGKGKRK